MLDPKEEAKFDELKSMCRELKVPAPPEIMIGLQVHEGGVLTFDDVQRGHSWTRNYWNMMFAIGAGSLPTTANFSAGYLCSRNTAGYVSAQSLVAPTNGIWAAAVGSVASGIVVGTVDTAFGVGQYVLAGLIGSGTGSGTFSYQACPAVTATYNVGTKVWTASVARIFNNNSGASITVKETGIYSYFQLFYAANGSFMMERSVLSPTVPVANGAQLTVTYAISMDFSAID
jgi:hypothetical protein